MILKKNSIEPKTRVKELLIDYLVIIVYLLCLLIICLSVYFGFFGKIPGFTQWQSQAIAFFSSVLPIVLIFTYLDMKGGTIGRRKTGLKLNYQEKGWKVTLLRNIVKFLPWQLGHYGNIRGMYTNYDFISTLAITIATILLVLMLYMGIYRLDKRHLADMVAGTQVQIAQ